MQLHSPRLGSWIRPLISWLRIWLAAEVHCGVAPLPASHPVLTFFPLRSCTFCCGLAGMVSLQAPSRPLPDGLLTRLDKQVADIDANRFAHCHSEHHAIDERQYLSGAAPIAALLETARGLKGRERFCALLLQPSLVEGLQLLAERLERLISSEELDLTEHLGRLAAPAAQSALARLEDLKDIAWCLRAELVANIEKVLALMGKPKHLPTAATIYLFQRINAVLNSIDRQEVRGRDSAGISIMLSIAPEILHRFQAALEPDLARLFATRQDREILINGGITLGTATGHDGTPLKVLTLTYKVAAEIGALGDNVALLRKQIQEDPLLQRLARLDLLQATLSTHTRWASVGAISEPNCHPVDNRIITAPGTAWPATIYACLNGDIDNFQALAKDLEQSGLQIPREVTTDTKIIPMQIEKYLRLGHPIAEAFRLALNDFEGSHAISMHTDLAPGKLFLAQRGSGQALFVGLAPDHFMPTSEVYGFIEETDAYLKLEGEKRVDGPSGPTQGQIFILSGEATDPLTGIEAFYYDGTPIALRAEDIRHTQLTSRDIDRQGFPHYFLKEISEAPRSVERTLHHRWRRDGEEEGRLSVTLDERTVPSRLREELRRGNIRRICFIGQGTAGVAAQACAEIFSHYLGTSPLAITAMKASELSGFRLPPADSGPDAMADTLVVAITQSGTTTDTNRAVTMARERGARTIAIVNRRDSDITFKVDGVMYTSSGRDIEMSVASTKAFYAQIVAGALLGLFIAELQGARDARFIDTELKALLALPHQMKTVFGLQERLQASARRLAVGKTYWAVVGSGPNKVAADEIRIKLSELCYKTISSDFVEDKKHIDLSAEPLIIVCAAGCREAVLGDIIKDTAIFQAHKAVPVVFADAGEERFAPYAADVFALPAVAEHLAPVLNTLAGHLWGYNAALAIHEGSRLLYRFREELQQFINESAARGLDVYEVLLEKGFREKIARFAHEFRQQKSLRRFSAALRLETAADLTLLLKYLAGRLPMADFELDFERKGTALNMINTLFECLGEAINALARPVDAIKHQAKTVTVGTSRISAALAGPLFDALLAHGFSAAQLITGNILVLKNLQAVVAGIQGAILYRIGGLSLLGEPTEETSIEVLRKEGVLKPIPSRVESDQHLKGTKRIIVRQGNVYIGKGRKDDRSIIIIPLISANPATPNMIEHLLLLNIAFRDPIPLADKIKALGGKYEHIQNIVQENSILWEEHLLELVAIEDLFGRSAEKIGEQIVSRLAAAAAPPA